jgi:hypothetical protein
MHAALFFYDDSFGLSFIAIGPRIGSHRKNTPFRRDAAHQEKTVSPLKIKVKIQKYTSIAIELFCFSAKIEQNSTTPIECNRLTQVPANLRLRSPSLWWR